MGFKLFKKVKKSQTPTSSPQKVSETVSGVNKPDPYEFIPLATESSSASASEEEANSAEVVNVCHEPTIRKKSFDGITSRDGIPVISSGDVKNFLPSDVMGSHQTCFKESRSVNVPSLLDSAYSGPPRYDWFDVESAAAIKIQSIFRRNKVIERLEKEGRLTAAIRNKIRCRQSHKKNKMSEDVPSIFRFCGIGFLFNDALGNNSNVLDESEKSKHIDKEQLQLSQEEMNRKFRMRIQPVQRVEEAVEVVDEVKE